MNDCCVCVGVCMCVCVCWCLKTLFGLTKWDVVSIIGILCGMIVVYDT